MASASALKICQMDPGGAKVRLIPCCLAGLHALQPADSLQSKRIIHAHISVFLVTKIKKDLIHKAKVKKAYAKVKAREEQQAAERKAPAAEEKSPGAEDEAQGTEGAEEQIHPTRQLMLADEDKAQANAAPGEEGEHHPDGHRRRTRRPGYYDKQLKKAEERRTEEEVKREEIQRRREERERKMAERERYKKAYAKTRDRDGKKKLGRESGLLLEKVKRMVAEN